MSNAYDFDCNLLMENIINYSIIPNSYSIGVLTPL